MWQILCIALLHDQLAVVWSACVGLKSMFHMCWWMLAFAFMSHHQILPKWFKHIQAVLCSCCPSADDPFVIQSTGSSHSALLQAVTETSAGHAFLYLSFQERHSLHMHSCVKPLYTETQLLEAVLQAGCATVMHHRREHYGRLFCDSQKVMLMQIRHRLERGSGYQVAV